MKKSEIVDMIHLLSVSLDDRESYLLKDIAEIKEEIKQLSDRHTVKIIGRGDL